MKFECVENGVRCIDDSVRISVAGDYGDIYAFDAAAHIKNHGTYPKAAAAVSETAARTAIPGNAERFGCAALLCSDRGQERCFVLWL